MLCLCYLVVLLREVTIYRIDCGTFSVSIRWFDWEEDPEKGLRQWKKVPMSGKRNLCICVWVREKKDNSFEITLIIFKAYKKCKSSIQK